MTPTPTPTSNPIFSPTTTDMGWAYSDQGTGVAIITTVSRNIVYDNPISHTNPSWITIETSADGSTSWGPIAVGGTVNGYIRLYPTSQNTGAERTGTVYFSNNGAYDFTGAGQTIYVHQNAQPTPPSVVSFTGEKTDGGDSWTLSAGSVTAGLSVNSTTITMSFTISGTMVNNSVAITVSDSAQSKTIYDSTITLTGAGNYTGQQIYFPSDHLISGSQLTITFGNAV